MRALGMAVALILVAGCIGSPGPQGTSVTPSASGEGPGPLTTPAQAPIPTPDEERGALSVLVTTNDFEPVAAAQVVVTPAQLTSLTDAAGRATFNGLEPGEYVVAAAKPGHEAREAEGRVARVEAKATAEVKLVLEPVPIITPESAFHETLLFRGLISCAIDVATNVQTTFGGYSSYCGRGVTAAGQTIGRDAADNSTHPWNVQNAQVEGWWFEAEWTPSSEALARQLHFSTLASYNCNVTCSGSKSFSSGGGASPYRVLVTEGEGKNITKWLGEDPAKYPGSVLTLVKGHCAPAPCAAVTLSQTYQAYATVFYGEDPPLDFSALSPA